MNNYKGFTLVELITVMVITGIIAMMVVNLITTPMEGYRDMKRRAELVDIAELTLHRMSREIHHALPNSIQLNSSGAVTTIAFLRTVAGGRYVSFGANAFDSSSPSNSFDILQALSNTSSLGMKNTGVCGVTDSNNDGVDDVNDPADCLVVYNLGQSGADAYNGDNITRLNKVCYVSPCPAGSCTSSCAPACGNSFSPADCRILSYATINFPYDSPSDRFFIVDRAMAFICNTATRELRMYKGYDFLSDPAPTGNYGVLLANNIASCTFNYNPGTTTRPGLVTLQIAINDTRHSNETVHLLHQVFVENQP